MPPDSVIRATVKKKPATATPNKVSNLVKILGLGILASGVIIANSLLPITAGENSRRDTINVLGGIETSADCTSTGCIQPIVGITESMDLYNLSGSFVIGEPASPLCELSATGALQGRGCSISANVTIAGVISMSAADARYVNTSGDTMTGALKILNGKSLQVAGSITGSTIMAVNSLTTSGALVWEGTGSGNTLHIEKTLSASGALAVEGNAHFCRVIAMPLCDGVTACAAGSGVLIRTDTMFDTYLVTAFTLDAATPGTTSTMSVRMSNLTDAVDLMTTNISLDSAEPSSDTAATPYVLGSVANRTITNGDRLLPRVVAVHTTPAKGVTLNMKICPQ